MNNKKFYSNKIAIVTGGASGIGKAICDYLAKYGSIVIIADINLQSAQDTVKEITTKGGKAKAIQVDVSKEENIKSLIDDAFTEFGRIDFLFNNAGVSLNGEFKDTTYDHWRKIIDINLWGVIHGSHHVYHIMMKQGFGQIINTASLAGLIPGGLTISYSTSKYAVVGFTLSLRSEAGFYGIKVNALCPGFIRTNIQATTPIVTDYMKSEKNRSMGSNFGPTPEKCVKKIMRGVKRNKAIIISPGLHKIFWILNRFFPLFNVKMFTKVIRRMKKQG
ncbi:MAG: SDR family NAD(P)-dependent oxidoreductase [Candidatus Thorarchaeota archaeon]